MPYGDREGGENFPVALRALPRAYRADLHAIYGFARMVDEIGDSFAGDRTARLEELAAETGTIWHGRSPDDPILRRLSATVRARGLPAEPFTCLIEANLQDQRVSRYATFAELRGYCRLSADPVGRIVLGVFGQTTPETVARSDEVCTALQLLEHWQDVREDRRAGRVYLPQEDLRAFGVHESDLDQAVAGPRLCALMRFEIDRAADLLTAGASIVGALRGWARIAVAGYVAGGQATVTALRSSGGEVLGSAARPAASETVARLVRLLAAAVTRGRPA